jgi:hypothetical protein
MSLDTNGTNNLSKFVPHTNRLTGSGATNNDTAQIARRLNSLIDVVNSHTLQIQTTTVTQGGGGGDDVDAAVPNFIDGETPSGTKNGSNKVFTLAHTPNPASSVRVFLNGQRLTLTGDYTFAGNTITFVSAPVSADVLLADYRY